MSQLDVILRQSKTLNIVEDSLTELVRIQNQIANPFDEFKQGIVAMQSVLSSPLLPTAAELHNMLIVAQQTAQTVYRPAPRPRRSSSEIRQLTPEEEILIRISKLDDSAQKRLLIELAKQTIPESHSRRGRKPAYTEAEQIEIGVGWLTEAEPNGEQQLNFAIAHNIDVRTLRKYVDKAKWAMGVN